ncbi:MAG: hypothetical protein LC647_06665 [Beggiatoa sp.]|nr:hypothetical protein [Beggiatoa sp.]
MPDAILAATASVHDLLLVTRNIRHFQHVLSLAVENGLSEEQLADFPPPRSSERHYDPRSAVLSSGTAGRPAG